jgi:hypothetical protein
LFYWKPGDFQDAYGIDDMTDMESDLRSNFKSFGDFVLDLLKKSRAKSRSYVALRPDEIRYHASGGSLPERRRDSYPWQRPGFGS